MGQNRKVGKSRNKNKLGKENQDFFELQVTAPLERVEPLSPVFPNYDFKAEVQKDAEKEELLLWKELIILFGILVFALLRGIGLAQF